MNEITFLPDALRTVPTQLLWAEIARRLKLTYGRIQMSFHDGKPSRFATITQSVTTDKSID